MIYFSSLFFKIMPLYVGIFMGFLAGKLFDANKETVAQILFFLITPIIVFNGVVQTHLDLSILALPFLTFAISSGLCFIFYQISKRIWQDPSKNLMAFSAGGANTGYFGLPIAITLFDEQGVGIYIMLLLGMTLYDSTVGYYIFAKGAHSVSEHPLKKVLKVPSLYAFLIGIFVNFSSIPIPEPIKEFMGHVKSTYTVLGMMVIGLGLSTLKTFKLDFKFIGMTFFAKFIVWPLLILTIIAGDAYFFGFFNVKIYNALVLFSLAPLAVNMVVLASLFKNQPEKAATAVLLSILFALVYIPVMTTYLIQVEAVAGNAEEITMR